MAGHKKKVPRLGRGEFARSGKEDRFSAAERDDARLRFLEALDEQCPKALTNVLERGRQVPDAFEPYDPMALFWPRGSLSASHLCLHNCFSQWCETYNLLKDGVPAAWCLLAAYDTAWRAISFPHVKPCWSTPGVGVQPIVSDADATFTIPFKWRPGFETRAIAEQRMFEEFKQERKRQCDRIETLAENAGARRTSQLRERLHFVWAVRFQVLEHEYQDILKQHQADESTVRRAVDKVLRWVDLTPRR